MPFIPPSLFSPDAYLRLAQGPAQSPFNVSLPHIDIPDKLPSLPSGDSVLNVFRALWQAIIGFFVDTVPTKARQFAADHPEVVKIGGIVVAVIVAAIALYFVLPLLIAVFAAILAGLASAVELVAVTTGVAFVFMAIEYLVLWVVWGVLHILGFTAQGIAAGSIAAGVQSAVYGGFTTGLFSMLQSLGMTIGRLAAGAIVTAVALVVA